MELIWINTKGESLRLEARAGARQLNG
jgi:hypothetical protein